MASYGAVVQRPSATSSDPPSQTQPDESKQTAARIIKNLGKFGLYYAELVWIVLFISLIPQRKVSLVYLVAIKEVTILYLLLLRALANSVLFHWLIAFDTRPIVLPLLSIGTCLALIFTHAGIHLLITLAATLPIILAHAILWIAEYCSLNEEINQVSVPLAHTV
ncbi:unnamed protein product [Withania somnifera]